MKMDTGDGPLACSILTTTALLCSCSGADEKGSSTKSEEKRLSHYDYKLGVTSLKKLTAQLNAADMHSF